jgi:hypothetical protein
VQIFKALPADDITLVGKKGTIVIIQKNSLVTLDDKPVTDEVKFEMLEVYSKADMILNNVFTSANNRILESSGMIHLKAYSKNRELKLKKYATYQVMFAANSATSEMSLFYGDTLQRRINWKLSNYKANSKVKSSNHNSNIKPSPVLSNTYQKGQRNDFGMQVISEYADKFSFLSNRFGWINCDRFINCCYKQYVTAKSDEKDLNYCLIFKSINSVMGAKATTGDEAYFPAIPRDMKVILLAYKKDNGKVRYYCKDFTVDKRIFIKVSTEEITESEFANRVKRLR